MAVAWPPEWETIIAYQYKGIELNFAGIAKFFTDNGILIKKIENKNLSVLALFMNAKIKCFVVLLQKRWRNLFKNMLSFYNFKSLCKSQESKNNDYHWLLIVLSIN